MAPWNIAICPPPTSGEIRIIIKLIVPDYVIIFAIVDLIESGPNRVAYRVTDAGVPRFECGFSAACIKKLLTKSISVILYSTAEDARSRYPTSAERERANIKLILQTTSRPAALLPKEVLEH